MSLRQQCLLYSLHGQDVLASVEQQCLDSGGHCPGIVLVDGMCFVVVVELLNLVLHLASSCLFSRDGVLMMIPLFSSPLTV